MKALISIIIIFCFYLTSCVSAVKSTTPSWVNNCSVSGKVAGIGICGTHVDGENAQRTVAIKRAIDEIALQLGVKVNNVALIGTSASSNGSNSTIESYSFQTVEGKVVKATIKETWKNPETDEIYIWMVTE